MEEMGEQQDQDEESDELNGNGIEHSATLSDEDASTASSHSTNEFEEKAIDPLPSSSRLTESAKSNDESDEEDSSETSDDEIALTRPPPTRTNSSPHNKQQTKSIPRPPSQSPSASTASSKSITPGTSSDPSFLSTAHPSAEFVCRPRSWTVSLAFPGSIIGNCQSRELKTYVCGQIARTAAIFNVDEVIIYSESESNVPKIEGEFRGAHRQTDPDVFAARILQYLETPQ